MMNAIKSNSQRDKKEKLIWALVVYTGLIKQTHMKEKVGVAPSSIARWKECYELELKLLDGVFSLLAQEQDKVD